MSTKNDKKDPIEAKAMRIRLAVIKAARLEKKQLYKDILAVLDDRDTWKRTAQTLDRMLDEDKNCP